MPLRSGGSSKRPLSSVDGLSTTSAVRRAAPSEQGGGNVLVGEWKTLTREGYVPPLWQAGLDEVRNDLGIQPVGLLLGGIKLNVPPKA